MEIFAALQPWHWFVLAVVLGIVEIVATTGFFIGILLAALVVAALLFLMPALAWTWQFFWFGVLSVALTIAYKVFFQRVNDATDNPMLNHRPQQLIGKTFVLSEDIDRQGAQMLGDTRWTIRSQVMLAQGSKVVVKGTDGMVLIVEPDEGSAG